MTAADAPLTADERARIVQFWGGGTVDSLCATVESILAARLDALHADNQRLERALTYGRAKEKQWRNRHDAARAERDALRDAITARAEQWENGHGTWHLAIPLRLMLSEAGERRE